VAEEGVNWVDVVNDPGSVNWFYSQNGQNFNPIQPGTLWK